MDRTVKNFRLGRGRAQGDNISPNTFNFGEQILLFKIELDDRIRSIWGNALVNPINNQQLDHPFLPNEHDVNSCFMYESLCRNRT